VRKVPGLQRQQTTSPYEEYTMQRLSGTFAALLLSLLATPLLAQPEYVRIEMSIDIDRPAAEVWAKVGDYCDISEWLGFDCTITSGDGGMGTVRDLAGGRIKEILVAQTELSYGYTQPAVEGRFYDLYHGFMEARPLTPSSSRMLYTLVYDVSNLADQAAKDADVERRRGSFERALAKMKEIAEAP
jgi:hypothetical protein